MKKHNYLVLCLIIAASFYSMDGVSLAQSNPPNRELSDKDFGVSFQNNINVNGNLSLDGTDNGILFPDGTKQSTAANVESTLKGSLILSESPTPPKDYIYSGHYLKSESNGFWNRHQPTVYPTPRFDAASVVLNQKVYLIGGSDSSGKALNTVEVFDLNGSSWEETIPLNLPRSGSTAIAYENEIYILGGHNGDGDYYRSVEKFSPSISTTWEFLSEMPTAKSHFGAVVYKGRIFTFGGKDLTSFKSNLEIFNISTNTWQTGPSQMPVAQYGFATCIIGHNVYLIGGYDGKNYLSTNYIYDITNDSWRMGPDMPTARMLFVASLVDDKIYLIGGYQNKTLSVVEVFDPSQNEWTEESNMPTSRNRIASTIVDEGQIWVIGGRSLGSAINTCEIFSLSDKFYIHIRQ